jgi:hypothetical protein
MLVLVEQRRVAVDHASLVETDVSIDVPDVQIDVMQLASLLYRQMGAPA